MIRIGVDVGGTNTDAVLMAGCTVLRKAKMITTPDVTSGIVQALATILAQGSEQDLPYSAAPLDGGGRAIRAGPGVPRSGESADDRGRRGGAGPAESAGREEDAQPRIRAVMVGTTHFVNALLQRRGIARIAVLRLCGPATRLLPPFSDWPDALREAVGDQHYLLPGGHEFDGREISRFEEHAVREAVHDAVERGAEAVALCGVFSPVNPAHEEWAAALIRAEWPELSVSLSHEIGRIGLLERENAATLNAALSPMARRTVAALHEAVARLGIDAPLFLSQNDGTLMDAAYAARYPVLAISSGPTNSMRGAAFLSGVDDGLAADIGGTSTDVGALVRGFPREAPVAVEIAGVRTNFRMPDLLSIALGGGSVVRREPLEIGPSSVGAQLTDQALVFGGSTLTATDLAVAGGRAHIGDPERVRGLEPALVERGLGEIRRRLEETIDRVKLGPEPVPLVLVGGGSILVGDELSGVSELRRAEHAEVANAIGAAIARVGGQLERVYSTERERREDALARAEDEARTRAVQAGAALETVEIVEVEEVPLTYLPGNAVRVRVKAVGDLARVAQSASRRAP